MPFGRVWLLLRKTAEGFIADSAFSHGASIAYFTLFSLAPALLVVISIAGLVFGDDAAQGAIVTELSGLMGRDTASALQAMIRRSDAGLTGLFATAVGVVAILVAISGVFGEVQATLNIVWKAKPRRSTLSRLVRARLASLGLVVALGFVLVVSLALSAALVALGDFLQQRFPAARPVLWVMDLVISLGLITGIFAIMYKVLPDVDLRWRDVLVGALAATVLFGCGKYLIALYIGQSHVATSFGAAGALIVLLLWIFYSAQIFLLGAEFTRAWTEVYGGRSSPGPAANPPP